MAPEQGVAAQQEAAEQAQAPEVVALVVKTGRRG